MNLINKMSSVLVVIDVQQRLAPAISDVANVCSRIEILIRAASALGIPVVATEQYPAGLGSTIEPIRALLPAESILEKLTFNAFGADGFAAWLTALRGAGRHQLVICGMESHVCVLQTAMSGLELGFNVAVVADAVGSRRSGDLQAAGERLARGGASIVTSEMVVFEWMERAATDEFRAISRLIR